MYPNKLESKSEQNLAIFDRLTMAVLALLEDIANYRIGREQVFRDYSDFLAYDDDWLQSVNQSTQISKSYPLGNLY